jgi:hypothetical protein
MALTAPTQLPLRVAISTQRNLTQAGALLLLLVLLYLPLGCAVGSTAVSSPQQNDHAATSLSVIQPQFFGMVVIHAANQPAIPIGSRRLSDPSVTWAALELAPGTFTWSSLDAEVASAQAANAEITLTLGMTPTWASSQPSVASIYGPGATAMPANLSDWDAYVSAVAARYAGRITSYEIWNSPSDLTFWSGPSAQLGADMATLSAHAAAAIHAADPNATIVAPAFQPSDLAQFLAAGGNSSVDVFSAAISLAGQAPETLQPATAALRSVMAGSAANVKPLWNDQPSWTLPAGIGAQALSQQDQAAYAARALILNAASGVTRLSWYAWDDPSSTSLQLSNASATPTLAAAAYATVESWLTGATLNGCSANAEQLWTCQLSRSGAPAWILWSPSGTTQASSLAMSTMTTLDGVQQPVSGLIPVGTAPVLLQ